MKKFLTGLMCAVLLLMLFIPVYACEDPGCTHEHSTLSSIATSVVPNDLDQDGDGVPDYMDGCIDLDGDGIQDVGPTYQTPGKSQLRKPSSEIPWITIILGCALVLVIAVTLIHKYFFKKPEDE